MKTTKLLAGFALALLASSGSHAAIIGGVNAADFSTPTIERFQNPYAGVTQYDFGNGMTYASLTGRYDLVGYTGQYGLGASPYIYGGRDGDGYFGTNSNPTSFQFSFAGGISHFGFFGAESIGIGPEDGQLSLEFYDLADNLISGLTLSTPAIHAWNQFHGFRSDAASIGRVVFNNAGYMVLDDLYFQPAPSSSVPEPASLSLLGLALAGLYRRQRKHSA